VGIVTTYLAVAGGISAGAQATRGLVRAAARLAGDDVRGAMAEAVGGLTAPVASACAQVRLLGTEVRHAARPLLPGGVRPAASSRPPAPQRRAPATKNTDSAAA
jgi:hypothetical protein